MTEETPGFAMQYFSSLHFRTFEDVSLDLEVAILCSAASAVGRSIVLGVVSRRMPVGNLASAPDHGQVDGTIPVVRPEDSMVSPEASITSVNLELQQDDPSWKPSSLRPRQIAARKDGSTRSLA